MKIWLLDRMKRVLFLQGGGETGRSNLIRTATHTRLISSVRFRPNFPSVFRRLPEAFLIRDAPHRQELRAIRLESQWTI